LQSAGLNEEMSVDPVVLYATPLCPFAHRTRLTLAEKRIEMRVIDIDLRNKPAGFLALSPQGQVPVLKVGDVSLWESAVIDEFLEETAPHPALLPRDPVLRARARAWIRFADTRLYATTAKLLHSTDTESRGAALAALRDDLRYMEEHAFTRASNEGPFWLGAVFTLVDVTFLPWFEQSVALEKHLDFRWPANVPALHRWHERVSRRDSVKAQSRPPSFYLHAYGQLRTPQQA
jgi:glutathione S-transferase